MLVLKYCFRLLWYFIPGLAISISHTLPYHMYILLLPLPLLSMALALMLLSLTMLKLCDDDIAAGMDKLSLNCVWVTLIGVLFRLTAVFVYVLLSMSIRRLHTFGPFCIFWCDCSCILTHIVCCWCCCFSLLISVNNSICNTHYTSVVPQAMVKDPSHFNTAMLYIPFNPDCIHINTMVTFQFDS